MTTHRCDTCPMRVKFDQKPQSFAGKFWRWHINFCPGWKAYFLSLPAEKQSAIRHQYHFTKY